MSRPDIDATRTAMAGERGFAPRCRSGYGRHMDEDHRPLPRDKLKFDIEQALRKARKVLPRKVEPGDFNPFRAVA